uniref:Uncharacterized protein n=1 Tax=Parascaris univalens TaxID=6257 RepID=A0A915CEV5_PARUN
FSDYEDTIQGKQKADTRSKASSKGSVRDNNVAVIAKRQRTPTRLLQRNVPHSQMQISADEVLLLELTFYWPITLTYDVQLRWMITIISPAL